MIFRANFLLSLRFAFAQICNLRRLAPCQLRAEQLDVDRQPHTILPRSHAIDYSLVEDVERRLARIPDDLLNWPRDDFLRGLGKVPKRRL